LTTAQKPEVSFRFDAGSALMLERYCYTQKNIIQDSL